MQITDTVLFTTRPTRGRTPVSRDFLEKLAEGLNNGTATAHPLKVTSAKVVDDEDGHSTLLVTGEWPDGVTR